MQYGNHTFWKFMLPYNFVDNIIVNKNCCIRLQTHFKLNTKTRLIKYFKLLRNIKIDNTKRVYLVY